MEISAQTGSVLSDNQQQEPVTHYIVSDFGAEFDKVKMMPIGRHPLYTAPVASDTDLRAERDLYKQALTEISEEFELTTSRIRLRNIARAALNPSEPKA